MIAFVRTSPSVPETVLLQEPSAGAHSCLQLKLSNVEGYRNKLSFPSYDFLLDGTSQLLLSGTCPNKVAAAVLEKTALPRRRGLTPTWDFLDLPTFLSFFFFFISLTSLLLLAQQRSFEFGYPNAVWKKLPRLSCSGLKWAWSIEPQLSDFLLQVFLTFRVKYPAETSPPLIYPKATQQMLSSHGRIRVPNSRDSDLARNNSSCKQRTS